MIDAKRFPYHRPNPSARLQLVCFPYAGGNAGMFREWQAALPAVEVVAFEPAGRGTRFIEEPLTSVDDLASEAHASLRALLNRPFAVFGHSLGAVVGWRVAHRFEREGRGTIHLFASGSAAPHVRSRKRLHDLPDDELIEELRKLNGTPREVLDNEELISILLPILRADFEASEEFVVGPDEREPLAAPITAFAGATDDEVPLAETDAWRMHTRAAFELCTLPGDHFFVHSAARQVLEVVARQLGIAARR